jgi:hypothetical protein
VVGEGKTALFAPFWCNLAWYQEIARGICVAPAHATGFFLLHYFGAIGHNWRGEPMVGIRADVKNHSGVAELKNGIEHQPDTENCSGCCCRA